MSDKGSISAEKEVEHDIMTLAISGDGDLVVLFIQVDLYFNIYLFLSHLTIQFR